MDKDSNQVSRWKAINSAKIVSLEFEPDREYHEGAIYKAI